MALLRNILLLFCFLYSAKSSELFAESHKEAQDYRHYNEHASDNVKNFYKTNHENQTVAFVLEKKKAYACLDKAMMGIWDVMHILTTVLDDSDPDTTLSQKHHAFQTAELLRRDNQPRWLILTGLIHDLGKILTHYGEPQWAVVGDTFPVGCKFSDTVVFPQYFQNNPDSKIETYQTLTGIYAEGCGLDNVHMSCGHDEYLYHVVKDYLPEPALFIIRYHSFYALHKENAYEYLLNDHDKEMLEWLKVFSKYDLYSKIDEVPDFDATLSYYKELVAEFFPEKFRW